MRLRLDAALLREWPAEARMEASDLDGGARRTGHDAPVPAEAARAETAEAGEAGLADDGSRSVLRVTPDDDEEDIFQSTARRGMARKGECVARVEGRDAADAGARAALVVEGFFHGAFRLSKAEVGALAATRGRGEAIDLFARRDALCDHGGGALIIDCDFDVREAVGAALLRARCEGYARALGTLPNNLLRTDDMARYLTALAARRGLDCAIHRDDELRKMGCGGILSVNRGSAQQAALVVLTPRPEENPTPRPDMAGPEGDAVPGRMPGTGVSTRTAGLGLRDGGMEAADLSRKGGSVAPLALVGKGVMFDAGGYHLKDIDGMRDMHSDMCGAAVAAETLECLALAGRGRGVCAVLPLVENAIGPDALKMGDVISTLSGKTVEVYNTDAEGRLILCDALTHAQSLGAAAVIDIATLTYGAQRALGDAVAARFTNDPDGLGARFAHAARMAAQPTWPMPLDRRYHAALRWSAIADLANYAPGYGASACTAAAFLEEFIAPDHVWLHIDAVGPSVRRGACDWECSGATGFGLRALARMIAQSD